MSEVTAAPAAPSSNDAAAQSEQGKPEARNTPSAAAGKSSGGVPTPASVTGGKVGGDEAKAPESDEAAPKNSAPKGEQKSEAQKEAERKLKLKINGQEREYSESEVIRRAQLAESAQERYQKAAEMQRQAEQFVEALRSDPLAVLTHPELGLNFREVAEKFLGDQVRREMMDPVERELEELRQFKQEQERRHQEAEEQTLTKRQQEEQARLQQQTIEYYDRKITEVLKASDLPKTPHTVKRVAEVLRNAVENGFELDIETAVDLVRDDYQTDVGAMLGSLEAPQLIKALGPQNVKKIMDHEVARLKALRDNRPVNAAPKPAPDSSSRQSDSRMLKQSDWLENIRKEAARKGF